MSRTVRVGLIAGIDVSQKDLAVAWKDRKGAVHELTVANAPAGHKRLAELLGRKKRWSRVVIEATGAFHFDVAALLAETPGIQVMLVNPLAARRFAQAQMRRAKTDRVDARMLLEFAERMEFVRWNAPAASLIELRSVGRHLARLVKERTALINQCAAAAATSTTPAFVRTDLQTAKDALEVRIGAAEKEALRIIQADADLTAGHAALLTVKGIADRSAILLASELAVLEHTMKPDEVVAHAGLDPRPYQSGTLDGARRTSKIGNARLRGAMFMPSLVAAQTNAPVREWYDGLVARGKPKFVALTAVARRLLRAVWIIYTTRTPWNDALFRPKAASSKPEQRSSPEVSAPGP
jgi:transposase